MMKSFVSQQNQNQVEENMSNLTSASNEASASSVSRNDSGNLPPQLYNFAAPIQNQAQPTTTAKKKRNLPGNPDPESEVIALSPKTLMATNRFLCEICNKGFQRDQNLQLHRRGHNLPWKLKQRTSKEIKKKVYVCPEVNCVHHEPCRALGDLTGIKKHFSRKHGEKKWKCDKCSKRYAVQSDWKAHSKTCGTREYRCDCGTLFSRRDSFITHRAFCDALAEESTRAITGGGGGINHQQLILPSPVSASGGGSSLSISQHFQFNHHDIPLEIFASSPQMKKEEHNFTLPSPSWLNCPSQQQDLTNHQSVFHSEMNIQEFGDRTNPLLLGPNYLLQPNSPHMSATALLQKAAQMGATMSINSSKTCSLPAMLRPHQAHESVNTSSSTKIGNFGTSVNNLSSCDDQLANRNQTFVNGLVGSAANKAAAAATASSGSGTTSGPPPSMLQDMMMNSLTSSSFEDAFGGIFKEEKNQILFQGGSGGGQDNNSMVVGGMTTRDFLGLRPLSQNDHIFLNIAALGNCMTSSNHDQNAAASTTTNQESSWSHGH